MNAPLLTAELFAPQSRAATSPPLRVSPALNRYRIAVRARVKRAEFDDDRQARRLAVLTLIETVLSRDDADTIDAFETVLNGSLDLGYRAKPLAAFVFDTLHRRLAGRVRRRLASSGHDSDSEEVSDLVATTAVAIQKLIRGARRETHTVRYALLLSIAEHRTIDYLRRRRPEYIGAVDDRFTADVASPWPRPSDGGNPERQLWVAQRRALAHRLRDAVFGAVNALPRLERACLILVEIEGLGYPEIAERLGIKRTDVGNIVRRARLRRDRALVPQLRDIRGMTAHVGFGGIQSDRDLRLSMLKWSCEMDGAFEVSPTWEISAAA